MILQRIREVCGEDFLIELRISAVDYCEDGKDIEESIYFVKECEDLIVCTYFGRVWSGNGISDTGSCVPTGRSEYQVGGSYEKSWSKAESCCNGGIASPEVAERFLAEGKADVVAMARAIMADPQLPNKIRRNQEEDIVPCLRCNHCLGSNKVAFFEAKCMVNPHMAHEHRTRHVPPAV